MVDVGRATCCVKAHLNWYSKNPFCDFCLKKRTDGRNIEASTVGTK